MASAFVAWTISVILKRRGRGVARKWRRQNLQAYDSASSQQPLTCIESIG